MKPKQKLLKEFAESKDKGIKKANIFLTKEQEIKLRKLKNQYQLSFGMIARIITFNYSVLKPLRDTATNERLYKTTGTWKKTSIKINCLGYEDLDKTATVNNVLIMYIDGLDKQILNNEKLFAKLHNEINNLFANTYDPFFDWDIFVKKSYAYDKMRERKAL